MHLYSVRAELFTTYRGARHELPGNKAIIESLITW